MLAVLATLVVLALILVVPVMIGARMVGADKTNFGAALFAVFMSVAAGATIQLFGLSGFIAFVLSAVVGAFLLAAILGTTFWRGMAVSVVAGAIQMLVFAVFLGGMLVAS